MLIPSALMQSMASFISQNIGAGKHQRARQTLRTGIGIGLFFGLFVFALVLCKGDLLCSFFTTDAPVIANGYAYLKGFALETILTAILVQYDPAISTAAVRPFSSWRRACSRPCSSACPWPTL